MSDQHRTVPVRRIGANSHAFNDFVTVEEPLELRIEHYQNGRLQQSSISVTMRTPGDDLDLAYGFLLSEGIVDSFSSVETARAHSSEATAPSSDNTVVVRLREDCNFDPESLLRHFYTSSSCGVCGKVSLAAVDVHIPRRPASRFRIPSKFVATLGDKLRQRQIEFERTGGLHASAVFDRNGAIVRLREDIGRHNALDKLIGSYRDSELAVLREHGLLLSGRASFELLQKAAIAGIPFVASIGPPSTLAIDLARDQDITLIGFLREDSFNQYHGDRVIHD